MTQMCHMIQNSFRIWNICYGSACSCGCVCGGGGVKACRSDLGFELNWIELYHQIELIVEETQIVKSDSVIVHLKKGRNCIYY